MLKVKWTSGLDCRDRLATVTADEVRTKFYPDDWQPQRAVTMPDRSLTGLDRFEVTEVRGLVKDGQVSQFQVKPQVGFRIFNEDEMRGA